MNRMRIHSSLQKITPFSVATASSRISYGAGRHLRHLLHVIGDAQSETARQAGQRAVVEPGTVAQPVAATVECQQRHQQEVGHCVLPHRPEGAEPLRLQHVARPPGAERQRIAASRRHRQHHGMAALVQPVQQRADVDLLADRPEPGHHGAGGGAHSASTRSASAAPDAAGSHPARNASARARATRLASSSSEMLCGAAMAVGVSSSQGLRVQVGAGIPRPRSRRASSRGGCLLAPGMNCLTHRAAPPDDT